LIEKPKASQKDTDLNKREQSVNSKESSITSREQSLITKIKDLDNRELLVQNLKKTTLEDNSLVLSQLQVNHVCPVNRARMTREFIF